MILHTIIYDYKNMIIPFSMNFYTHVLRWWSNQPIQPIDKGKVRIQSVEATKSTSEIHRDVHLKFSNAKFEGKEMVRPNKNVVRIFLIFQFLSLIHQPSGSRTRLRMILHEPKSLKPLLELICLPLRRLFPFHRIFLIPNNQQLWLFTRIL